MALESATNFKAALALAAVQLNAAMQDTVLSEMAVDIRNPFHPLRKLRSLFSFDPATGLWSSNDAYVDKAYAGVYPNSDNRDQMLATDLVAITLTTATVEDAAKADIVLTFSRNISSALDIVLGGAGSAGKTVAGIAIVDNVVTVTASADYANGDVITISGNFGFNYLELVLADESVTNNVV
jgi:hypothetical protein